MHETINYGHPDKCLVKGDREKVILLILLLVPLSELQVEGGNYATKIFLCIS